MAGTDELKRLMPSSKTQGRLKPTWPTVSDTANSIY